MITRPPSLLFRSGSWVPSRLVLRERRSPQVQYCPARSATSDVWRSPAAQCTHFQAQAGSSFQTPVPAVICAHLGSSSVLPLCSCFCMFHLFLALLPRCWSLPTFSCSCAHLLLPWASAAAAAAASAAAADTQLGPFHSPFPFSNRFWFVCLFMKLFSCPFISGHLFPHLHTPCLVEWCGMLGLPSTVVVQNLHLGSLSWGVISWEKSERLDA